MPLIPALGGKSRWICGLEKGFLDNQGYREEKSEQGNMLTYKTCKNL